MITIITLCVASTSLAVSLFSFLTILYVKAKIEEHNPLLKEEEVIKADPFIDEIMHYAFDRDLSCIVMPGQDQKNTLFDRDNEGAYSICELFTTSNKPGTKEYNDLKKKITDQIDHYIENKALIKTKINESKSENRKGK